MARDSSLYLRFAKVQEDGMPAGVMGVDSGKLEMLFLDL